VMRARVRARETWQAKPRHRARDGFRVRDQRESRAIRAAISRRFRDSGASAPSDDEAKGLKAKPAGLEPLLPPGAGQSRTQSVWSVAERSGANRRPDGGFSSAVNVEA
jgi:hypothetical protein